MLSTLLAPIVGLLIKKGLGIFASAVDTGGEKVVELIEKKTGLTLTNKADLSANEISTLRALERDSKFRLELEKIELAELQERNRHDERYLSDIASARNRQTGSEFATGKRDINLYAIAWTVIIGFFILCGILMKFKMPAGSSEVVFMLFGSISSGFGMVLSYFFGSSKSSQDKTTLLAGKENKDD